MKYSLRSLMIVVMLVPPLLAGGWFIWQSFQQEEQPFPYYAPMPHSWDENPPDADAAWDQALKEHPE